MKTCKYKYNVYEFEIVYYVLMSVNIREYRVYIYTHIYEYMYTYTYRVYARIVCLCMRVLCVYGCK